MQFATHQLWSIKTIFIIPEVWRNEANLRPIPNLLKFVENMQLWAINTISWKRETHANGTFASILIIWGNNYCTARVPPARKTQVSDNASPGPAWGLGAIRGACALQKEKFRPITLTWWAISLQFETYCSAGSGISRLFCCCCCCCCCCVVIIFSSSASLRDVESAPYLDFRAGGAGAGDSGGNSPASRRANTPPPPDFLPSVCLVLP